MGYSRYRMGSRYRSGNSIEVTKRELLVSIIIVLLVISFGVWLVSSLQNSMEERNELYYKAVKIDNDSTMFNYAQKTDVGNALVYGSITAVDRVSIPEIKGDFLYIERIKEEYTRHTRTVTKTDSNGKTYTKTEVYYSWDYKGTDKFSNAEVELFENKYPTAKFDFSAMLTRLKVSNEIFTPTGSFKRLSGGYVHKNSDVRYYYKYVPTDVKSNFLVNFRNSTIEPVDTKHIELHNGTILERIESLEKSVSFVGVLTWVVLGLLTLVIILKFVSGYHHWLERD